VAVPATIAETTPLREPIDAIEGAPQLQVPPVVAQLSVVVSPAQNVAVPDIIAGFEFTVTVLVV
jgi:hypothetical protein